MSDKKGFSGLDSLSSDIDDILNQKKETNKEDNDNLKNESVDNSTDSKNTSENLDVIDKTNKTTNNSEGSSSKWIWWVIGIGFFIWILNTSNSNNSSSSKSSISSNTQQSYTQNSPSSTYTKTTTEDDYYESKPDSYLSILNKNQLLYCEAEKIRLDAVQNKIDLYSTYEVDKFNALTNDYNSRCANKQYYKNDMYYVERNIEKRKYELEKDGIARFPKSNNSSSNYNQNNSAKTENKNINNQLEYSLTIKTIPSDARVRILNISPKYKHGIKLEKGSYHIEVSKDGYEIIDQWITLNQDIIYTAELKKNSTNNTTYSISPDNYNNSSNTTSNPKSLSNEIAVKSSQKPDMSNLTSSQRSSIESTCGWRERANGPADYYQCIRTQISQLGY